MGLTNYRSQSLPPSHTFVVKDSRVTKPTPRNKGVQCPLGRYNSPHSWGLMIGDNSQGTQGGSSIRCSIGARDLVNALSNSKASSGSSPNPDSLLSLTQALHCLGAALTDCPNNPTTYQDMRSALEAAEAVVGIGREKGWLPRPPVECTCSQKHECGPAPRSKREEQAIRKGILDRAAKEHSDSRNGKFWTQQRTLAAYGRQEIELDGQKATIQDMGRESWCTECEAGRRHCILVEKDRFWHRGQCVECVQRKTSCSLDKFGAKRERPER